VNLEPFNLERIQSEWEHFVDFNLSESGVEPLRIIDLLETTELKDQFLNMQLGYSQTNGTVPLREAIAQYYPGSGAENILATNGGAEANFLVTWWLFHENPLRRELVFMVPNYMQMSGIWKAFGGKVRTCKLQMAKRGWIPDIESLKDVVTDGTAAIMICNPNNPTGSIIDTSSLKAIVEIADEKGVWVVSDEVYRGAEMKEEKSPSMFGRYDKTIVTSSLSKVCALPGLRLGWAACPSQEVATQLWNYSDYTTICPSKMSDWLAVHALRPEFRAKIERRTRKLIRENWSITKKWLDSYSALFEYVPPSASAICFIKQKTGLSSLELVMRLLKEKSVLIAPGEYFEVPGFIRIGFGADREYLERAFERFSEFLDAL